MAHLLGNAWASLREFRRQFLLVNLVNYGLFVLGVLGGSFVPPSFKQSILRDIDSNFSSGAYRSIGAAYQQHLVLPAIGLTFVANLLIGKVLGITLPSLIFPFSGIVLGAAFAAPAGVIFSLAIGQLGTGFDVAIAVLFLLELLASNIAIVGTYIQSKAMVFPQSLGLASRREGLKFGLRHTFNLYVLIVLVLAAAALYEVFLVFEVIPSLR